jgi:uncharacterized delta-60 repeat protein
VACCCLAALAVSAPAAQATTGHGSLDPSFGEGGKTALALDSEAAGSGELTIAAMPDGSTAVLFGDQVRALDAAGRPEAGFGDGGSVALPGLVGPDFVANSIAVDQSGRILVAGTLLGKNFSGAPSVEFEKREESAAVVRIDPDGRLDSSFGNAGIASFTFGFPPPSLLNKYTGTGPEVSFSGVAVDADQRPVLTGLATTFWQGARDLFESPVTREGIPFVARLTVDGSADLSFGGSGVVKGEASSGAFDPVTDGQGRVAYIHGRGSEGASFRIGVAEESGLNNPSLGGRAEQAYVAPAIGPDDRIYVLQLSPIEEWGVIVPGQKVDVLAFNWDGSLDTSFHGGRPARIKNRPHNVFWNIAVDSLGRVVVGGQTGFNSRHRGSGSLSAVRLSPSGALERGFARKGWGAVHIGKTRSWYGTPDLTLTPSDQIVLGAVAVYEHKEKRAVLARLRP